MKGGETMEAKRVNAELYLEIKEVVESGDYTLNMVKSMRRL